MKRLMVFAIAGLLLAACQTEVPAGSQEAEQIEKQKLQEAEAVATVIDWVDFVQFAGKHYVAADSAVINEQRGIGGKAGVVEFKVAENINSTNYQVKNGDAAFWEKGTELFKVKGLPDFLTIKDDQEVNGYRLYLAEGSEQDFPHHFKDVDMEQVKAIEIYTGEQGPELLNRIQEDTELEEFNRMLTQDSVAPPSVQHTSQQDPDIYQMILYTDAPFAHAFYLYKENGQWLWYPWDQQLLPNEIEKFIHP